MAFHESIDEKPVYAAIADSDVDPSEVLLERRVNFRKKRHANTATSIVSNSVISKPVSSPSSSAKRDEK